jgi:hypothetical protein
VIYRHLLTSDRLVPQMKVPSKTTSADRLETYLSRLPTSNEPLSPLTPLSSGMSNITAYDTKRSTRVMSILNVTPDSFSDGGKNYDIDEETLAGTISAHIILEQPYSTLAASRPGLVLFKCPPKKNYPAFYQP